jgi:isocitrate dehydrogenase
MRRPENVDIAVFRENTEDVYSGLEWEADSPMARKIMELVRAEEGREIRNGSGIGLKPISLFATRRLVRMAIRYALDHGRRSVTLVHKGNIMKFTEGAFRNWGYQTARDEFGDQIVTEEEVRMDHKGRIPSGKLLINDRIADAMFQQVILRPAEYAVLPCPI